MLRSISGAMAGLIFVIGARGSASGQTAYPTASVTISPPQSGAPSSGTMTITFNTYSQTVEYGVFSTPSSIASAFGAKFSQDPLTALPRLCTMGVCAKANGATVTFQLSAGSSFGAFDLSSTGDNPPQMSTPVSQSANSCTETTVVAWINKDAIQLPSGASLGLKAVLPPIGIVGGLLNVVEYPICASQLLILGSGHLGAVSDNATDKAYASAWLLKFSGNEDPGMSIDPSALQSQPGRFRFFNDYSPGLGIHRTAVGDTLDPCGSGDGFPGDANINNGNASPPLGNASPPLSLNGYQYQISEVRVDQAGRNGWAILNNNKTVPWVWSVVEFDQYGNPVNIDNSTNYQIFPTYSIYKNGKFINMINQSTITAFANLPSGSELSPGNIQ